MAAAAKQAVPAKKTPVKKRSGPGRPPFVPDDKMRTRVCRLVSVGLTHDAIAVRLGITNPTLRKHFAHELLVGADLARAEMFEMMFGAAEKGNVAAMKALREIQAAAGARDSILRDAEQPEERAEPVERLGKKQQQLREAAQAGAGTAWGDDLNPSSIRQ